MDSEVMVLLLWLPALPRAHFYEAASADDGCAPDGASMIWLGLPDTPELQWREVTRDEKKNVSVWKR